MYFVLFESITIISLETISGVHKYRLHNVVYITLAFPRHETRNIFSYLKTKLDFVP